MSESAPNLNLDLDLHYGQLARILLFFHAQMRLFIGDAAAVIAQLWPLRCGEDENCILVIPRSGSVCDHVACWMNARWGLRCCRWMVSQGPYPFILARLCSDMLEKWRGVSACIRASVVGQFESHIYHSWWIIRGYLLVIPSRVYS